MVCYVNGISFEIRGTNGGGATVRWFVICQSLHILTTVVAQRIIVAGPLAIGPRLGLLAVAVAAHLLALLRRRASLSSRSSTAAAGVAASCSVLMSLYVSARLSFSCGLLAFSRDFVSEATA